MGQQPLILENSFTTRIPADVDEDRFSPSSTVIPTVPTENEDTAQTYLSLKCKLVLRLDVYHILFAYSYHVAGLHSLLSMFVGRQRGISQKKTSR